MPCLSRPSLGSLGLGLAEGVGAEGITNPLLTPEAASALGAQKASAVSMVRTLTASVFTVVVMISSDIRCEARPLRVALFTCGWRQFNTYHWHLASQFFIEAAQNGLLKAS